MLKPEDDHTELTLAMKCPFPHTESGARDGSAGHPKDFPCGERADSVVPIDDDMVLIELAIAWTARRAHESLRKV